MEIRKQKWHNNSILTATVCDSCLNYPLETSFQNNNYASSIHEFHLPPLLYNCTHLSNVLIIFIKRLSILPVVKCGYTHDVFFFVDNRQGQDIFNDPTSFIYRSFLQTKKTQVIFQLFILKLLYIHRMWQEKCTEKSHVPFTQFSSWYHLVPLRYTSKTREYMLVW